MRSHAKASSARTSDGSGSARRPFGRARATRDSLRNCDGSGAPAAGSRFVLATVLAALALALTATPASAAAPAVLSVEAAEITNTTAQVSGSIERDLSLETFCMFEYISNADYAASSMKQRLTVKATGGSYKLNFQGEDTPAIAFNAPASSIDATLEALPKIGAGNVAVTGGPGSPSGSQPYTITFMGALANKNVGGVFPSFPNTLEPEGASEAAVTTITPGHAEGFENAGVQYCEGPIPLPAGGSNPTAVSAKLSGLQGNSSYHLRLRATNTDGEDALVATNFKTTAVPQVQTLDAVPSTESATLVGRVNPFNAPDTYQFEWGVVEGPGDETYENVVPPSPLPLNGESQGIHAATAPLAGLAPNTTYHYRISVTNTQTSQVVRGEDRVFKTTTVTPPPGPCPNESSRVGPSAGLPDCRAYEFVSPGLNGAGFYNYPSPYGAAAADGNSITYEVKDAPLDGEFSTPQNIVVNERTADGWSVTRSLAPAQSGPQRRFFGAVTVLSSVDSQQWITWSTGEAPPPAKSAGLNGNNGYFNLHKPDGTWISISNEPTEEGFQFAYATPDFSHILFGSLATQNLGEPQGAVYEWADNELRVASVLPGPSQTLVGNARPAASNNGALQPLSEDGNAVLFIDNNTGTLYLRVNHSQTLEPAKSRRTPEDPVGPQAPRAVGVTADGAKVFFISKSELTEDANTGVNDAGADLYSYDVESDTLTDLTVADKPADAATGANVREVIGASPDGSYIYFTATGNLAKGAISGEPNLYVEHGGTITFVAPASGLTEAMYVTPDGRHASLISTESLTGYNSAGQAMAFEYTYGGGLECASCRPNGSAPTAGVGLGSGAGALVADAKNRSVSDDGSRLFFQTTDQVLPEAKNGLMNVYEYSGGQVRLLSPGDTPRPVSFLDASASGDDVFLATNEELVPGEGEGTGTSVFDARVGALRPPLPPTPCVGENCRDKATSPPNVSTPGTAGFIAPGRIVAPKSASSKSSTLSLRVSVPGQGKLNVSGQGLKSSQTVAPKAGFVTVKVRLKPGAERTRVKRGLFRTTVSIAFTATAGESSKASVALKFTAPKPKKPKKGKGGK